MNWMGRWTFGRQVHTKVLLTYPPPPRDVDTKLGLSFFLYVLIVEGAPVCCTIQFMTTTCFQAILQTSAEINLPMFGKPKANPGGQHTFIFINTHVLNLETQNWHDNVNNVDKSGRVTVKEVGRVFNKKLSRAMRKCVLWHMRITKAQISLRIRAG